MAGADDSCALTDRSHALRGNASTDALRSAFDLGRGASRAAFPRGAWERSTRLLHNRWRTCDPWRF
ncbi:DUF1534 domain-containing protein [Pseudomonas umsongensis]|nr:DUF1534 domain-containing protein [Pseudomonas umsongensis]